MVGRVLGLLPLVAGCGQLFNLTNVELPVDASVDAPIDAALCGSVLDRSEDEDLDTCPNAIDLCPGIYDDQADDDRDGVGNACDPHPLVVGDKIVAREFFNAATSSWSLLPVTDWSIAGGVLTSSTAPDSTNASISLTIGAKQPTLELGFTLVDYGPSAVQDTNKILTVVDFPNAGARPCHLLAPYTMVIDRLEANDGAHFLPNSMLSVGVHHTMWSAFGDTPARCQLDTTFAGGIVVGNELTRSATISVVGVTVSLSYVLVYGVD